MKKFKKALATTLAVLSAASALCIPVSASADTVSQNEIETVMLNSTRATNTFLLSNYPCVIQTGNLCWAYCVQSIVTYVWDFTPTISDIQLIAQNSPTYNAETGFNESDTVYVLQFFLSSSNGFNINLKYGRLNQTEIKNYFIHGLPFMMTAQNVNNTNEYHNVMVVGYDYNTSTGDITALYIMNPQTGIISQEAYSPNTRFSFTARDGREWRWYHTITLI